MDAQTLYQEGITALKERKDKEEGRKLLMESLRLDPNNDMAWLWLTRTMDDPQKRLQCLDRALAINPNNQQALELKKRMAVQTGEVKAVTPTKRKTSTLEMVAARLPAKPGPNSKQQTQIEGFLEKGQDLLDKGDTEGAIAQWAYALEIQPDHEIALRNAIQHLAKLNYMEDVKQLVNKAVEAGTTTPSIYLTAIDIAKREEDHGRVDDLRDLVVRLPTADDKLITMIVDDYLKQEESGKAMAVLEHALQAHPNSQKLLIRMGDLKKKSGWKREAMVYYDRAAKLGVGSKEGRAADKAMAEFAVVITDKERGSLVLAWREAAGFGAIFLLMGWHDAGLDLVNMGARWSGVPLAMLGGYLLVTATSSPQQAPLARLLGGRVPQKKHEVGDDVDEGLVHDPTELPILPLPVRVVLGAVGAAVLIYAFTVVFNTAIQRWNDHDDPIRRAPDIMSLCEVVGILDSENGLEGFLTQIMSCTEG